MTISDAFSIYSPANRRRLVALATFFAICIAVIDWRTESYLSLGFLYLFPIMLVSGCLSRKQIVCVAIAFAFLQEFFSNLPSADALTRLVMASVGFLGTGLLVHELVEKRRLQTEHLEQLHKEVNLRREAEKQLTILVDSSPAAIVTIDQQGQVLLANDAARSLLGLEDRELIGSSIRDYLPALLLVLQSKRTQTFRTAMHCRGQKSNGDAFMAGVWFSTYNTLAGLRLAAIIVDLSEDLCDREDLSLNYLLKNARILMSAVSHEIRNMCGAANAVYQNLERVKSLEGNADFEALGSLIQGLEKISTMELGESAPERNAIDLIPLLDELRVLLESAYEDEQIVLDWNVSDDLPLVWADHYGLIQVFLNLAKNSMRALLTVSAKRLSIEASCDHDHVFVRFRDTGPGIKDDRYLFRPFQRDAESTGLGLYVSRAIVKSFGGDLVHEPSASGCTFCVKLQSAQDIRRVTSA